MLAGKVVQVTPHIGELEEGLFGSASPEDLPLLFQMMHLELTAPRRDDGAFSAWKAREEENAKNRRLSPETVFQEDFTSFFTQGHLRRRPVTTEVVGRVDLGKAFDFYKQRFAHAEGFTFVLVGNLDLDKTRALAETYLGSLPTGRKETWKDVHVTHPKGVTKKQVAQGAEPKSTVWLIFHGDEKWSRDNANDVQMAAEVLKIRLREVLREDMGGVYGVSVGGAISRRPRERYQVTIRFGCAPENVAKLEQALKDEIRAIQDHGIGEDYITKVKEQRRRAHETSLRENGYWLRELEDAYLYGDDPKVMLDFDAMVDKVSSARVQKAMKRYLSDAQYALGELRPASSAP